MHEDWFTCWHENKYWMVIDAVSSSEISMIDRISTSTLPNTKYSNYYLQSSFNHIFVQFRDSRYVMCETTCCTSVGQSIEERQWFILVERVFECLYLKKKNEKEEKG